MIHQLRASLERDTGLQAATYLQEAGFAGGEELYALFTGWLASTRGIEHPADMDVQFFGEVLAEFFAEQGWGRLTATPLGPVLALDSTRDVDSPRPNQRDGLGDVLRRETTREKEPFPQ